MKLIFCQDCKDIVRLTYTKRYCECGKIWGRYVDNLNVETSENAIPTLYPINVILLR